nr:hypothetical protein I308_05063 [Cryptococcus tetragattii IND107]
MALVSFSPLISVLGTVRVSCTGPGWKSKVRRLPRVRKVRMRRKLPSRMRASMRMKKRKARRKLLLNTLPLSLLPLRTPQMLLSSTLLNSKPRPTAFLTLLSARNSKKPPRFTPRRFLSLRKRRRERRI